MFITLADKFNNAFLWAECDLWGGARVGNYTLSGFSPTPHAFLVTTLTATPRQL